MSKPAAMIKERDLDNGQVEVQITFRCGREEAADISISSVMELASRGINYVPANIYHELIEEEPCQNQQ